MLIERLLGLYRLAARACRFKSTKSNACTWLFKNMPTERRGLPRIAIRPLSRPKPQQTQSSIHRWSRRKLRRWTRSRPDRLDLIMRLNGHNARLKKKKKNFHRSTIRHQHVTKLFNHSECSTDGTLQQRNTTWQNEFSTAEQAALHRSIQLLPYLRIAANLPQKHATKPSIIAQRAKTKTLK